MTDDIERYRDAWVRAAEAELGVSDEDGSERIEEYFERIGWGFWIAERGYVNVEKYAWCGVFLAAAGLRIGHFLEPDRCVDVSLNPDIARYVLPSTIRLTSRRQWQRAGYSHSHATTTRSLIDDRLCRGCVATVGDGPSGSHIVMVSEVDKGAGTITTIEGNAIKAGFEGVVSKTRQITDIVALWRPGLTTFETLL